MYVRRVVLENVRGFESLDFKLERPDGGLAGWTVITGDNASGKTAFLKAAAIALVGPDAARVLQPSFKGWIRKGCGEAVVAVEIRASDQDRFATGRRYERPFWSELHLRENGGPEVSLEIGRKYTGKGKGPTHGPWAENPEGWFCAGYGPFRRLYGASPDAQRLMSAPGRLARFATMFREDATLGECELWLRELHHKSLEKREKETSILQQVLPLLNDDFLRHGMRVHDVNSEGLWLRDSSDVVLALADMSDGYRAALAMLVDILRHMIDVYGHERLVEERDGRLAVRHPGVVLIDEVDSHLHPEWQRCVGFWLKERFPFVQFIITTHSPIICQAADEDGIFHLPAPGSGRRPFRITGDDYREIIRSKPDAIYVSPAFGMEHTRSPMAVDKRREYARLRAKEHAGRLSPEETASIRQLQFWAEADEDGETCAASHEVP